jgi:hypothetical protein
MPDTDPTPEPLPLKDELPVSYAIVCNEIRAGVAVPVAAFEFRTDGHVKALGAAAIAVAWPKLIKAARKAGRIVARQHLGEAADSLTSSLS